MYAEMIRNVKSLKKIPVLVICLFSLMIVTAVCFFISNEASLAKHESICARQQGKQREYVGLERKESIIDYLKNYYVKRLL